MSDSVAARKYVDGIYIPVALLVVGTLMLKQKFVPYAAALAVVLGGLKFVTMRKPK